MNEIEASTRASSAQIIIAKLVLAGAAEIVIATIICGLTLFTAEYPITLIQIILYVIVPFLGCMVITLWSMRSTDIMPIASIYPIRTQTMGICGNRHPIRISGLRKP